MAELNQKERAAKISRETFMVQQYLIILKKYKAGDYRSMTKYISLLGNAHISELMEYMDDNGMSHQTSDLIKLYHRIRYR